MISTEKVLALAKLTSNPFYVYSKSEIQSRCRAILNSMPAGVQIYYSLKANSHPALVQLLREEGLWADVASIGELEIALNAGFPGSEIEFTGPGKRKDELQAAVKAQVAAIVIESIQELAELEAIGTHSNNIIPVCVRLNPKAKVNHMGRSILNSPSHFGIDEESGEDFRNALSRYRFVRVTGTHSHIQSQILSSEIALKNLQHALEAAAVFSKSSGFQLRTVNLGGGLGIPYSADQAPVDFSQFAIGVRSLIKAAQQRSEFSQADFRLEFGRYIVGEAGMFVTRVLYTKISRGRKFVITDGGFTQSQISCGIGQSIRRNLPMQVFQQTPNSSFESVTIAGPSCYGLDILADEINLPAVNPGDLIGIRNVGAYGYSFSPQNFLRQSKADEFFI